VSTSLEGSGIAFRNIPISLNTQWEDRILDILWCCQGVLVITLLTMAIVLLVALLLQDQWCNAQWQLGSGNNDNNRAKPWSGKPLQYSPPIPFSKAVNTVAVAGTTLDWFNSKA
jgi:hypothetical protein